MFIPGIFEKYQKYFILFFLIFCMVCAFWIRTLPSTYYDFSIYKGPLEPDIWYTLRQIEVMIQNFPGYPWFDPMTAFPEGKEVDWGPLLPFICAAFALLAGVPSRPDFISIVAYAGPVIAVLMIPVVYLLGKYIWDPLCGLIAALVLTFGTNIYFYRTTFGYVDHHGLEVLLSSAFFLTYILAVKKAREISFFSNKASDFIIPVIFSTLAGGIFAVGLLNMPTILLFALIIAIFTLFCFIFDFMKSVSSDYLLVVNGISFTIVLFTYPLYNGHIHGNSLSQYSPEHFVCYLLLIIGTIFLWLLRKYVNTLKVYIAVTFFAILGLISVFIFTSTQSINAALALFLSPSTGTVTISEMRGVDLTYLMTLYNYGLVLFIAGLAILMWRISRNQDIIKIFLFFWSILVTLIFFQHRRFEYYFAVNFALLFGIAISESISFFKKNLILIQEKEPSTINQTTHSYGEKESKKHRKPKIGKRKKETQSNKKSGDKKPEISFFATLILGTSLLLGTFFIVSSAISAIDAVNTPDLIDSEWVQTLLWMKENTLPTGVNPVSIYERESFSYPNESYGVMAWWDYGHYITFIGNRIPITNPFQDNLAGKKGVAGFFMAEDEEMATELLSHYRGLYVITDTRMVETKFSSLADWYNSTAGTEPYLKKFFVSEKNKNKETADFAMISPHYYQTMGVRLHYFDGSYVPPSTAYYLEYKEYAGLRYPIATVHEKYPVEICREKAARYNSMAFPGTGAVVLGGYVLDPVDDVSALRHFRLIYESSMNSSHLFSPDSDPRLFRVPYIKVFEYVPGARIPGEGTIVVEMITNTGREFIYQQKSQNGEFIVPYSTEENTFGVRTKGKYHIVETGREFAVSERDVKWGRQITQ